MTISFQCQHCHKEVKAPDATAGKRGKCPYCGHSSYIPYPGEDEKEIPLAPVDPQAERQREDEIRSLAQAERQLRSQLGGDRPIPLEHRQDLASEDLHHFVVNYCLDMSRGLLDKSALHVTELKKFGYLSHQAVEDFITGKAAEDALAGIPPAVLNGFLSELSERLN